MSQYALALNSEEATLAKARSGAKTSVETLLAADATEAWKLWEFATKTLFEQLGDLDKEIGTGLKDILTQLDQEQVRHEQLTAQLAELTRQLEERMGGALSYITDQYARAIDTRRARHQKWRADIEWLGFQGKLQEEVRLNGRYQLEQQILNDQFTDLKQGALWQWPN
jgi:hypothetical protein